MLLHLGPFMTFRPSGAVTRLPHQTAQALTFGEDFVTSNPHTCSIGKKPLCQVSQGNFSPVCGSRSFFA